MAILGVVNAIISFLTTFLRRTDIYGIYRNSVFCIMHAAIDVMLQITA